VAVLAYGSRALDRPSDEPRGGSAVEVGEASTAGEEAVDAGTIRTAAASAQEEIDAHRDPGDAIVAAWVQLEEASARAGRARVPSETPGSSPADPAPEAGLDGELETLLGLYESVRFGGERPDEAARATARRCLATIEEAWR
jgi:hypothetical protein